MVGLSVKEVAKTLKLVNKVLRDKGDPITFEHGGAADVSSLVRRFCSNLGQPVAIAKASEHIARRISEEGILDGSSFITVAAVSIYVATMLFDVNLSRALIAEHTSVSEGTLRIKYRLLQGVVETLVDPVWIEVGQAKISRLPHL